MPAMVHTARIAQNNAHQTLAAYASIAAVLFFYFSLETNDVSLTSIVALSPARFKNNSKRTPVNTTTHKRHMPMVSKRRSVPSTFPPKEWTLNS
mmetsp:Transcript_19617/g.39303  ORF Transcript_19617/g.39303 Transcript_19617/m.39303 type:complete len:94 (+) Transcript_19617:416-697(+)